MRKSLIALVITTALLSLTSSCGSENQPSQSTSKKSAPAPYKSEITEKNFPNKKVFSMRAQPNNDYEIFIRRNGQVKRLTTNPAADLYEALSPNEKRVAFLSMRDSGYEECGLYVINADGTGLKRVTTLNWEEAQFNLEWLDNKTVKFVSVVHDVPSRAGVINRKNYWFYEDNIIDIETGVCKKTGGRVLTTRGDLIKKVEY